MLGKAPAELAVGVCVRGGELAAQRLISSGHVCRLKSVCEEQTVLSLRSNLITHLLHLSADCFCRSVIILLLTSETCAAARLINTVMDVGSPLQHEKEKDYYFLSSS